MALTSTRWRIADETRTRRARRWPLPGNAGADSPPLGVITTRVGYTGGAHGNTTETMRQVMEAP
jgi:hypothetical protein